MNESNSQLITNENIENNVDYASYYHKNFQSKIRKELTEKGLWTGKWVVDVGFYLKDKTDTKTNNDLEKLFNNGQPQEGLNATGRWITTSGISYSGQEFTPRMVTVFEKDGDKYGRVIENANDSENKYADGTPVCSIDMKAKQDGLN